MTSKAAPGAVSPLAPPPRAAPAPEGDELETVGFAPHVAELPVALRCRIGRTVASGSSRSLTESAAQASTAGLVGTASGAGGAGTPPGPSASGGGAGESPTIVTGSCSCMVVAALISAAAPGLAPWLSRANDSN